MTDENSPGRGDATTERDGAESADSELALLRDLSEEGRVSLDHQITAIQNSATQSFQVLRLNIILLGAVLSAVPVAARFGRDLSVFVNLYSVTGALTLFGSVLFAAAAITVTNYTAGIGSAGVTDTVESDLSRREFYQRLSSSYSEWLVGNYNTMEKQSVSFFLCMALFIDSLLFLGSGIVAGLYTPSFGSRPLFYVLVVLFAIGADLGLYRVRGLQIE